MGLIPRIRSCTSVSRFTNSYATIGAISINARGQALVNGGSIATLGQVLFSGPVWKFNNADITADRGIVFDVSGTLTDPGDRGTPNQFTTANGFELRSVGTQGDLLGTSIKSTALANQIISHVWASSDSGRERSSFDNNVALGKLTLGSSFGSQFHFDGLQDGGAYALYVDSLVVEGDSLSSAALLDENIAIGNDLTIYVSELTGPPGTEGEISAELLDGKYYGAGRIVWARNFAGLYGGTDALVGPDGPVIRVNRTLRNSLRIDTDADGIPNGLQEFPFKPITVLNPKFNTESGVVEVKFYGAGGVSYELQYSSEISGQPWVTVASLTVPGEGRQLTAISGPIPNGAQTGFYRIVYAP